MKEWRELKGGMGRKEGKTNGGRLCIELGREVRTRERD